MKSIKISLYYILTTLVLNIGISIFCYNWKGLAEFKGYLAGTILSFFFSIMWIIGTYIGMKSDGHKLMKIFLGGFFVRLIILPVFVLLASYIFDISVIFFAVSFLVGTILSLIIEVWFIKSLNLSTGKVAS